VHFVRSADALAILKRLEISRYSVYLTST